MDTTALETTVIVDLDGTGGEGYAFPPLFCSIAIDLMLTWLFL